MSYWRQLFHICHSNVLVWLYQFPDHQCLFIQRWFKPTFVWTMLHRWDRSAATQPNISMEPLSSPSKVNISRAMKVPVRPIPALKYTETLLESMIIFRLQWHLPLTCMVVQANETIQLVIITVLLCIQKNMHTMLKIQHICPKL